MAAKVKYRIDLINVFDQAFASKGAAIRSKLRPLVSEPEVRREIGRVAVDRIIERTHDLNIDKNSRPFPGYSKSYTKALPYKVYKKTGEVNLTLTGEMLASMVVKADNKYYIDIVMADQLNNDKAHGNIHGSYGRQPSKKKARDFLGLPDKEISEIVKAVVIDASGSRLDINIGAIAEAVANRGSNE